MASQTEVINYIRSNYKHEELDNGIFKMLFDNGGGRSQMIFARVTDGFLQVNSPFAHVDKVTASRAIQVNDTVFGITQLGDFFMLCHVTYLEDIDQSEIEKAFGVIAFGADKLESKLGKIDRL